jgi:hypothetical protein
MIYADPGSGILIWQLLLALFFGATFFISRIRHWVISKLRPGLDNATFEQSQQKPHGKIDLKR